MHGMHLSGKKNLSKTRVSRLEIIKKISIAEIIAKTAFILATVIDVEVVETKADFSVSKIANTQRYNTFSDLSFSRSSVLCFS